MVSVTAARLLSELSLSLLPLLLVCVYFMYHIQFRIQGTQHSDSLVKTLETCHESKCNFMCVLIFYLNISKRGPRPQCALHPHTGKALTSESR